MQINSSFYSQSPQRLRNLMQSAGMQGLVQRLLKAWPDAVDAKVSYRAANCETSLEILTILQDAGLVTMERIDYSNVDFARIEEVALTARGKGLVTGKGTVLD